MSDSPRAAKIHRSNCRRLAASAAAAALLVTLAPRPPAARAQTLSGAPDLVISQVYTRGGEPGAAFQNDYVELFNRGSRPVDMSNWGLHIVLDTQPSPATWYIRLGLGSYVVEPGRYVLIKLAGGPNGATAPCSSSTTTTLARPPRTP